MTVEVLKSWLDVLTVVLLGLTFFAGAGVLITGNIINRGQEEKLRRFDHDLTIAKSDLAVAVERAADATKAAEIEKIERLKLEASIQPRDISAEEFNLFRMDLNHFVGRFVSVRSYAMDAEASRLSAMILSALHSSGITTSDQRGNLMNLGPGWNVIEGIQIAGPHSQDDLINALLKSPLGTDPHLKMFRKEDPRIEDTTPVEILVGVKPVTETP
jgi:hypothetical protein